MRRSVLIVAAFVFGTNALAQTTVSFECYPNGPLPLGPAGSCEGVASNGLGLLTGVTSAANCGFPTAGSKYVRLNANGPVAVGGTSFPWPVSANNPPAEVRVPIPAGTATLSFDWEYFNAEGIGSTTFNDGMAVGLLDSSGTLVQQLAYADNQVPYGGCVDAIGAAIEILPGGAQSFVGPAPVLAGCEYLSIVCWNGGDNGVPGVAFVDNIVFSASGASCPVPCFPGSPTLGFSSPGGSGCILATIGGMPPNGTYFLAISLIGGAFPNGWFLGIDIPIQDLVTEILFGYPFSGPLNACGSALVGQFCGVAPGISVFAVALGINAPVLGPWSAVSSPVSYLIP